MSETPRALLEDTELEYRPPSSLFHRNSSSACPANGRHAFRTLHSTQHGWFSSSFSLWTYIHVHLWKPTVQEAQPNDLKKICRPRAVIFFWDPLAAERKENRNNRDFRSACDEKLERHRMSSGFRKYVQKDGPFLVV